MGGWLKYTRLAWLACALVCRALAEDAPPATAPGIGLLLPPEEAEAMSVRQGAELGAAAASENYHLPLQLMIRGRVGQWGADGEEAGRMVLNDGVRGLIAPPGGAPSHLALQVSGRTATPVVSLCPDSSVIGAGIPWMVQVVPGNVDEAKALFSQCLNPKTKTPWRWGCLAPIERAGREIGKDLRRAAKAAGSELAEPVRWDKGQDAEAIKAVLAANPEGILLWLDPEPAGRLVGQLRKAGFGGRLAGPGRLDSPVFWRTAGESARGFILAKPLLDEACQAVHRRFAEACRKQFGQDPDTTAAYAYDAAVVVGAALHRSGEKPPYTAFPLVEDMPGASGPLKFRSNGERIVSLTLWEKRNDGLVPLMNQDVPAK
jgi:branched-chain amino acid transport system substrate-binding protein